ncbi:MAG: type II secretion system protein [Phycisphaeraceae bacterium]
MPELLAVIAIVMILLAMLMPNIASMREHARFIQCQNVMRQTAIANRSYSIDHNGWFIYNTYGGSNYKGVNYTRFWSVDPDFTQRLGLSVETVSNKWLTNPGIYGSGFAAGCQWPDSFDCPSQGKPKYCMQNDYWGHESGIAYNREKSGTSLRSGGIVSPSSKFQFADGDNWWMNSANSDYKRFFDLGIIDNGGWGGLLPRHRRGNDDVANIAFYDAHVEAVKKEETFYYGTGAADLNKKRWDLAY